MRVPARGWAAGSREEPWRAALGLGFVVGVVVLLVALISLVDDGENPLVFTAPITLLTLGGIRWAFGDATPESATIRVGWLHRVAPILVIGLFGAIFTLVAPFASEDVRIPLAVVGLGLLGIAELLRRVLRPADHAGES